MHVRQVLSRWLGQRTVVGHARRAEALVRVAQALVLGSKATLTQLGRNRAGSAHVKHHIKAVDRLLGNAHLHRECSEIYRAIAKTLFTGTRTPVLTVDWSDFECGGSRKWAMLQAAVPIGGRVVVVYSRVFPFKRYNSPAAHREFLNGLKLVLPDQCRPVLITDAGFRGPWFRAVEAIGWDWVGRIRNRIKYLNEDTARWCFTDSLYKLASASACATPEAARCFVSRSSCSSSRSQPWCSGSSASQVAPEISRVICKPTPSTIVSSSPLPSSVACSSSDASPTSQPPLSTNP